ncbi:TPA: hypothetical protein ACFKZP_09580 [Neisseria gonorrhoeae]|uniref:Uncharacterized protein n=4 Tax=Neisseria gonorrhoeae TaxID=485 RepID=Q5F891_NEIG1|nr:hypothetical protein NGO_0897 [Neisseria gonorrhoeae FA 1090]ACF29587.1 Conserved hypothetical protein [Neisseria gonorrhoeae NCCP11945]ANJ47617.1 hypothetical protein ASO12_03700 [Neisseria gonorrhoeae]APW53100.1 hypothetical protein T556_04135 [Neisseria gonorrhoeae NG-k51.05]EEH62038.1 predicted protein [Neisseria gonorrhoeae 1291]EEZ43515.1 conserved hypothetical protein [Neisseria gonorrhoeae 35/02]EEZ50024.1 predicted protein [Neisseria gonorrhoeae PID18]EEZ52346.1 predicted protein
MFNPNLKREAVCEIPSEAQSGLQTGFAIFIAAFLPYPDFCLGLKQIGSQIAIEE